MNQQKSRSSRFYVPSHLITDIAPMYEPAAENCLIPGRTEIFGIDKLHSGKQVVRVADTS